MRIMQEVYIVLISNKRKNILEESYDKGGIKYEWHF